MKIGSGWYGMGGGWQTGRAVLKTANKQKNKTPTQWHPLQATRQKRHKGVLHPAKSQPSQQDHTQNSWNMVADATGDIAGISTHGNQQASDGGKHFKNAGPLLAFYFQGLGPCPGAKPPQCRLTQTARPCLNANIGFVRCHQGSGGHFWDRQGSTSDKHARCVGCAANQRRRGSQCSHTASCSS